MSKKKQETPTPGEEDVELTPGEETGCTAGTDAPAEAESAPEEDALSRQLAAKEEQYLRLAAEYDNFRNAVRRKRRLSGRKPRQAPFPLCSPSTTIWNGQ